MKWRTVTVIVAALVLAVVLGIMIPMIADAAPIACSAADAQARLAQEPELYVIAGELGVPPNLVACDKISFDADYGWKNQLDTSAKWSATYWDRANLYTAHVGARRAFSSDMVYTFPYRLAVPIYAELWEWY